MSQFNELSLSTVPVKGRNYNAWVRHLTQTL
jgi:hypothetical protein